MSILRAGALAIAVGTFGGAAVFVWLGYAAGMVSGLTLVPLVPLALFPAAVLVLASRDVRRK